VAQQVENVLTFRLLILFFKFLNLKNLSSAGKRTTRFLLAGACVSYVSYVHCVACVALDGNPALHAAPTLTVWIKHVHRLPQASSRRVDRLLNRCRLQQQSLRFDSNLQTQARRSTAVNRCLYSTVRVLKS